MDIKKRLTNKTFVVTMTTTILACAYQVLGMFGVVPPVTEETAGQVIGIVANVLVGLGVLINPTTDGIGD